MHSFSISHPTCNFRSTKDNHTGFRSCKISKAIVPALTRCNLPNNNCPDNYPSRETKNPRPRYAAATIFNFSCNAAKFLFIALSVNSAPVTIGYFFNGP